MRLHGNARTCLHSRLLIVRRIEAGWTVAAAAEAAGVSERTAAKWLARYRGEGRAGLVDRSSAPRRVPRRTAAERERAIESLRRLRMTAAEIAEILRMPLSTVSAVLQRIGHRQRLRLPLAPTRARLPQARHPTQPHQTPPTPHQRQSRALHPDHALRLGLRTPLRHQHRTSPSPTDLAQPLQLPQTTRQPRQTASRQQAEQRVWEQQLAEPRREGFASGARHDQTGLVRDDDGLGLLAPPRDSRQRCRVESGREAAQVARRSGRAYCRPRTVGDKESSVVAGPISWQGVELLDGRRAELNRAGRYPGTAAPWDAATATIRGGDNTRVRFPPPPCKPRHAGLTSSVGLRDRSRAAHVAAGAWQAPRGSNPSGQPSRPRSLLQEAWMDRRRCYAGEHGAALAVDPRK